MNLFKSLKAALGKGKGKKTIKFEKGEMVIVNLTAQMPKGPTTAVIRYVYPVGYLVEFRNEAGAQCFAFADDTTILDAKPQEYQETFEQKENENK